MNQFPKFWSSSPQKSCVRVERVVVTTCIAPRGADVVSCTNSYLPQMRVDPRLGDSDSFSHSMFMHNPTTRTLDSGLHTINPSFTFDSDTQVCHERRSQNSTRANTLGTMHTNTQHTDKHEVGRHFIKTNARENLNRKHVEKCHFHTALRPSRHMIQTNGLVLTMPSWTKRMILIKFRRSSFLNGQRNVTFRDPVLQQMRIFLVLL